MTINPDIQRLRKEIDALLEKRRPDRYTVRDTIDPDDDTEASDDLEVEEGTGETKWLDDIADEVAYLVPDEEVRKLYARKVVGQQEGSATGRANRLLRKISRSGQLLLGWWGGENDPVAVTTRIAAPGKRVRVREQRVALRAMTSRDFRDFAAEERKRAANDFAARNETCNGAEWVAKRMDQAGAVSFLVWAMQECPPPAEGDDPS